MRLALLLTTSLALQACDDAGTSTAQEGPAPDAAEIADAAAPDAAPDLGPDALPPRPTAVDCFSDRVGELRPDYDQFGMAVGRHCKGSDHQDIEGVEKVVFLGDSVTVGTPPTRIDDWFRNILGRELPLRFGDDLEIVSCAEFGARTDDLLIGKREIEACFPDGGDPKRTLVLFTIGGNDISAWAQDQLSLEEARAAADQAATLLEEAVRWFHEPGRFPNGVFVVYANPYEYTDATGDLESCELAATLGGLEGNWIAGAQAVIEFQERFARLAVETGSDMVFALEHFCGHGYHHDDPASQCYLGPDAELWFDVTCIHPNTAGHAALADLFLAVIDE